jgi:acyl-CoA synthetase (NDP forming)
MQQLGFEQSKKLLARYGIMLAESETAETTGHAVKIAQKLGFPVEIGRAHV